MFLGELGFILDTTVLAVSYLANSVPTLSLSFLVFENDKIVTIILNTSCISFTCFMCINSFNPRHNSHW